MLRKANNITHQTRRTFTRYCRLVILAMKKTFANAINHLIGDLNTEGLEARIFNSLMIITFLAGFIATIYNVLLGNQLSLTACSALGALICSIAYVYSRKSGNHRLMVRPVILFFFVIMIVSWLTNAGTEGAGAYFFFLLTTIGILLMNKRFPLFMAAIIATLVSLLALEYYYPTFMLGYTTKNQQFLDVSISMLLCLLFNGLMIHLVFSQYLKERDKRDALLTQVIRDKEALQQSNDHNRVLLKEVYHRTKNNMLVIISMLNLRAMDVKDERFQELSADTENRIRAMALVHEQLYQSRNLYDLDFSAYLQSMVTTLVNNMILRDRVKVEIDCPHRTLSIDTAVPLGLAINEIVTNSLKHAFPDDRVGKIQMSMTLTDNNIIELMVGDDGIGLPAEADLMQSRSFGMQITTNLVLKQLKGTLDISRENGTVYTLRFPDKKRKDHVESVLNDDSNHSSIWDGVS